MVERGAVREEKVTPLELFFDLVFVFALTQVSAMLAADATWPGLGRAVMVLAALWWAWVGYAWLTNTLNPDEGGVRLAVFAAMGAMLIASLAVPQAFDRHGVIFAVAYLLVRVLHILLYAIGGRLDEELIGAVFRLAPSAFVGSGLLLLAGFLDGAPKYAAWLGALAIDYVGPVLGRGRGWRVHPAHFAERHALIIIVALGESIVAIAAGAAGMDIDAGLVVGALAGMVVVAALWWLYFDVVAIVAERKLTEARGVRRAVLARDSYSYLHFPMIVGIVLFAVGLKKTLASYDQALSTIGAVALCGGVSLYLLGHVAFRLNNVRSVNKQRLLVAALLLALVPAALAVDALVALSGVALVSAVLVAYEAIRFREARARVRGLTPAVPAPE